MSVYFQIPRGRWRARMAIFLLAVSPLFGEAGADPTGLSEYQVKAAFIYNFAKFIEWPPQAFPSTNSPVILGVVGDDPTSKDINAVAGRTVGTHRIQVEWFPVWRADLFAHAPPQCQILYLLPSERLQAPAIMETVRSQTVLTICDGVKDFAQVGATINLITTPEGKIRFEINIDAAKRAGLKIESPLLNLARIVREQEASK